MPKLFQLHERLFIRGHTRNIAPEEMLRAVHTAGIKLVLCVTNRKDQPFENAARLIGISYRHEPLSDGRAIPEARVRALAADVAAAMKTGGVLVHCEAGRNRSVLIAIVALMQVTGRPAADVLADARKVRPAALANKTFEQFVLGGRDVTQSLFAEDV